MTGGGRELHPTSRLVREVFGAVEVAVLAATGPELTTVIQALSGAESVEVWGRRWWGGPLPGRSGRSKAGAGLDAVVMTTGVGVVNTAQALTSLLEAARPELVIQVGVAGAFAGSGAAVGDLAVASSEAYADLGVAAPEGWLPASVFPGPIVAAGSASDGVILLDSGIVEAAARILRSGPWDEPPPQVFVGPFLTSSQVTGTWELADRLEERWAGVVESMEGAAAAHVCALYDVPFLEVRGVSNLVVDRDRDSWELEAAARVAGRAGLLLCARSADVLAAGTR